MANLIIVLDVVKVPKKYSSLLDSADTETRGLNG